MFPALTLALILGQSPKPPTITVVPRADVTKPVQVAAEFGRSVTLTSDSPVSWDSCDTFGLVELIPSADKKSCVFLASQPGRYIVLASAAGSPSTKIEVTVGKPGPAPDPLPPPPIPPPVDPIIAKMKAAYDADTLQLDLRRKGASSLVAVYSQAAKVIEDPAISSVSQHSAQVKAVADQLFADDRIDPTSLAGVRKVLADELKSAFPSGPPSSLTADVKKQIDTIYTRAAAAIKAAAGV